MTSVDLSLQSAMVSALRASAVLSAAGASVFDRAPDEAPLPLVTLGEVQTIDDGSDCLEGGAEIFVTWHVWARDSVGTAPRVASAAIADGLRTALHHAALDLGADWSLVEIGHRDTRIYIEADGLTGHAVVTFRALVDPAL